MEDIYYITWVDGHGYYTGSGYSNWLCDGKLYSDAKSQITEATRLPKAVIIKLIARRLSDVEEDGRRKSKAGGRGEGTGEPAVGDYKL